MDKENDDLDKLMKDILGDVKEHLPGLFKTLDDKTKNENDKNGKLGDSKTDPDTDINHIENLDTPNNILSA